MHILLDADILTYRAGFASEDFGEAACLKICDAIITDILTVKLPAVMLREVSSYAGYLTLSRESNFRHKYAVTAPYKGQRSGKRPKHYDALRRFMVDHWKFKVVEDQEADDEMGIVAMRAPNSTVIVTIDKDLLTIPSWNYNFVTNRYMKIEPWWALRNFYEQILTGDTIDNVKGLYRCGPVKAAEILGRTMIGDDVDYINHKYWTAVVDAMGYDRALENARLLYIRQKYNEIWSPPDDPQQCESEGPGPTKDGPRRSEEDLQPA